MYDIKTFNAIAPEGLANFNEEQFTLNQTDSPSGILLRSQKLHDYPFPTSVLGIARAGAGTNNIPVQQCTENGVIVFNTPGANANAVKELVLACLFLSVRPILKSSEWVQTLLGNDVEEQAEANKKQFAGTELQGKKLGVIGLGAIGAMVANDAYRLGMDVTGYDPFVSVDTAWSISRRIKRAKNMDEVLQNCDFITVHVPLTENTQHLISYEQLEQMKKEAVLLNFSRSELINIEAVIEAIDKKTINKFITDFADKQLLNHEQILVLPHLGASTEEAEINCAKMATKTLRTFLETGNIDHSVNFPTVEMGFYSPFRLSIIHKNVPNMLSRISTSIASLDINIDTMINRSREDYAYTLVDISETDETKIISAVETIQSAEHILRVRIIKSNQGVLY